MSEITNVGSGGDRGIALVTTAAHDWSSGAIDLMKAGRDYALGAASNLGVGAAMRQIGELALVSCLCAMPDGTKPIKVGADAAKFLKDELGSTEQYMDGNTAHIKLDKAIYKDFPGAPQLWFDKDISFDVKMEKNKIEISNISGVMVDPGAYKPWAYVKSATFERKDDGSYVAKVTGGRFGINKTPEIPIPESVYNQLEQAAKDNLK